MKKIITLLAFVIFTFGFAFPQELQFVVLTVKGSVSLYSGAKAIPVRTGEKIFTNNKVKVGKKSYLNLVYMDGKTLEVKSPGTYDTGNLIRQVNSKKNSSTKKFTNFVLAEFVKSVDDLGNMKVTGSVERLIKFPIDYAIPNGTNIFNPAVTFKWFSSAKKSYVFKLADNSGTILYTKELEDTSETINLLQLKLKSGEIYKWFVSEGGKEKSFTDTSSFYLMPKHIVSFIKDSINILNKELRNLDPPTKQILLASFFANNGLYIDMMDAYEKAIKLSPDNVIYKKLYAAALYKAGLKRKAELLLNK